MVVELTTAMEAEEVVIVVRSIRLQNRHPHQILNSKRHVLMIQRRILLLVIVLIHHQQIILEEEQQILHLHLHQRLQRPNKHVRVA